ncbi:MAG TPA: arabinan endo-1,5-alpha-L-arabinosidase [Isosphaeraceae bacterium]|jgi:arabinan endo-1,5-alpha-L-arabinosidase|nr:arabinan endo-1,5-alpha-L-arabinosidase [Isosphaeraceae bacterium]
MNRREILQLSAAAIAAAGLDRAEAQQAPASKTEADPTAAARVQELGSRGVRVHDPSMIVKCKDEYWVFYTGLGVPSYRSQDLMKWEAGPRVFEKAPPWVAQAVPAHRGIHFWAPEITRLGDRYLLYYSVSTFGNNTSAIGLATSPILDPADPAYHWTDEGIVIQSTSTDTFNAIDPAVARDAEGGLWLAFGSFWSGIKLVPLDSATGKRIAPDSPIHALAHSNAIEAACIDKRGDFYYLIVNWGRCCRGVNSTYNMRVGRSPKVTGPYVDKNGKDLLQGGGTLLLETDGPFIGPGHAGIFEEDGKAWLSMHFYDGSRRGASTLAIRPLRWDADGWPVVGQEPRG